MTLGGVVHKGDFSFSEEKIRGKWALGFVSVGLEGKEGGGCNHDKSKYINYCGKKKKSNQAEQSSKFHPFTGPALLPDFLFLP